MAKVQHYRGLNTNLEKLYDSIKWEIEVQKDLEILSEYKSTMNSIPLGSIVVVNKSPTVWAGSLREIHVSITGNPNDYAVEVASGAWFGSLLWIGAVGLIVGGPVGLAAGATVGGIMAYELRNIMEEDIRSSKKRKWEPTYCRFYWSLLS